MSPRVLHKRTSAGLRRRYPSNVDWVGQPIMHLGSFRSPEMLIVTSPSDRWGLCKVLPLGGARIAFLPKRVRIQVSSCTSLIVAPPIGGSGRLLGPRPGLDSLPVGETPALSGGNSSRRHTVSSMFVHLPLCPAWLCLRCCRK